MRCSVTNSKACVLFSDFAVKVNDSQVYGKINIARKCISFTLDPRDFNLSLVIGSRTAVPPVLIFHPRNYSRVLEVCNCSKLLSFILDLWMPLALFVISVVYSARISILYFVQVQLGLLGPTLSQLQRQSHRKYRRLVIQYDRKLLRIAFF